MLSGILWIFTAEAQQHETAYARTAAVSALVLFEAVYLISSRFIDRSSVSLQGLLGNRIVLLSIAVVAVFQLLFVYTPPFQVLFDSQPLDLASWNRIWLCGLILFVVIELEKSARRLLFHGSAGLQSR
jgi:magnesium-transporting ATPase (P-type)